MVRQKTKKTRRLKGGKYVGEGTYGCGYYPALRCAGEAEREPGSFSKLLEREEAESEYELGNLFRPIDPQQKYFLYPHKICEINKTVLPNPENNVDRCQGKFANLDSARVLQYKNGGETLDKLKLTAKDYMPFFTSLNQLLEGLDKLHDGNVAHMDIKTSNIVFLKDTSATYHIRYIDFGLSVKTNMNERTDEDVYIQDYFAWPFNTRFIVDGFGKSKITRKRVNSYLESQRYDVSTYPYDIYYDPTNKFIMNVDEYKKIFDEVATKYKNRKKWLSVLAKKTDVYSLARVLAKLYTMNIGHYYRFGSVMVLDPRDITKKVFLADLQALVSADEWEWHSNVAANITVPFLKMIRAMMDVNPLTRMTAKEALAIYNTLLEPMSIYFMTNKIKLGLGIYFPEFRVTGSVPTPRSSPSSPSPPTPSPPTPSPSPPSPGLAMLPFPAVATTTRSNSSSNNAAGSIVPRFPLSPASPSSPLIPFSPITPSTPEKNGFFSLSPNIKLTGRPPLYSGPRTLQQSKKRKTRKARKNRK